MIRTRIVNTFIFLISLTFFSYLFYIQCFRHQYYNRQAKKQHEKKFILLGARGNIYDRNGIPLATSEKCYSVFCTPRYTKNKSRLAHRISRLSGKSEMHLRCLIDKGDFFWVDMKVNLKERNQYLKIDDPAIGFTHDLNRLYNMPEIFVSLIGKCGLDNRGIEGLELQLNDQLSGKSGFAVYQKDPNGEPFPYHNYPDQEPQPGFDVFLTIDFQLQSILYKNLRECMWEENAQFVAGMIIDPKTGEILALVNVGQDGDQRNHIVCDEFEPGSTFKLVPLAYALMNGVKEQDKIDTGNGRIKVKNHMINDFKKYGVITFEDAIAHSSNVAMVKIARNFNQEKFFLLMRDFGFGEFTGIELPGEIKGRSPNPTTINDVEFATLVFGQGLTVSLLQLAFAYQLVANEGVLNKPIIVSRIIKNNRILHHARPLRIRRVLNHETTERITDILCGVIEKGSGTAAALDNIRVAGKTGTAQKVVDGKYSNASIIATFIGYFPATAPDYLIAIMVDEPKSGMWASTIAAPVFKNIAQSICQINSHHYAVK